MSDLSPLTHVCGIIDCMVALLYIYFVFRSIRLLRLHRQQERTLAHSRGKTIPSIFLGFSLPTLLRCCIVASTIVGAISITVTLIVAWLVVPESDDSMMDATPYSMMMQSDDNRWSARGQLCIAISKFAPPGYGLTKIFTYLFFGLKARSVRPTEPLRFLEKLLLFATIAAIPIDLSTLWLVNGGRSEMDGICRYWIPMYIVGLMAISDILFSVAYLGLFLEPLRAVIAANKQQKQQQQQNQQTQSTAVGVRTVFMTPSSSPTNAITTPGTIQLQVAIRTPIPSPRHNQIQPLMLLHAASSSSNPPSPSAALIVAAAAAAAAPAASSASVPTNTAASRSAITLLAVMRKNTLSCLVAITSTMLTMTILLTAHITSNPILIKIMYAVGNIDLAVTLLTMLHLMVAPTSSSAASSSAAATNNNNGANGAQQHVAKGVLTPASAPAVTVTSMADHNHQMKLLQLPPAGMSMGVEQPTATVTTAAVATIAGLREVRVLPAPRPRLLIPSHPQSSSSSSSSLTLSPSPITTPINERTLSPSIAT